MPHQSELTEAIAQSLEGAGYSDWAKRLRDALFGSTGTEINMALAHTLKELGKAKPKLDDQTKKNMKELKREINKALKWW